MKHLVIITCVKQQNHLPGSINSASQLTALEGGTWHMQHTCARIKDGFLSCHFFVCSGPQCRGPPRMMDRSWPWGDRRVAKPKNEVYLGARGRGLPLCKNHVFVYSMLRTCIVNFEVLQSHKWIISCFHKLIFHLNPTSFFFDQRRIRWYPEPLITKYISACGTTLGSKSPAGVFRLCFTSGWWPRHCVDGCDFDVIWSGRNKNCTRWQQLQAMWTSETIFFLSKTSPYHL